MQDLLPRGSHEPPQSPQPAQPPQAVHPACFCSQEGPEPSPPAQCELWGRGCAGCRVGAGLAPLSTEPLLGRGLVLGTPRAMLWEQPAAFPSCGPAPEGHRGTGAAALPKQPVPTPLQGSVTQCQAPARRGSQQAARQEEEGAVVQRDTEGSAVPSKPNSVQVEGWSSFRNGSVSRYRLSLMAASPQTPVAVTRFPQSVPVLSWPVCWDKQAAK